MSRKQKRYLKEAAILIIVFIAAVNIFGYFTNRGKDNMTADMGAATYPQIAFPYGGYTLNTLSAYRQEMDIPSMRDTITPVNEGQIEMKVLDYGSEITSIECKVCTTDGEETLFEKTVEQPGESVTVAMDDPSVLAQERMLQIQVNLSDEQSVYYYTRLVDAEGKHVSECLEYIKNYHENAMGKVENVGVGKALEPDDTADNTSLQHVTIHSDYDHVSWGELNPSVEGKENWMIKELNGTSSSVQLQYQVRAKGEENDEDIYKVKEFFRVRYDAAAKEGLLLDYDRTMDQIFDATRTVLGEKGLILGIADPQVEYVTDEQGEKTAFVQAEELWYYDKKTDHLSQVFSFASAENTDERNRTAQHKIEPLEMDKDGNVTFAVYGYMNRGAHEGEVGVAVYYYNAGDNSVEERAFLSTTKSSGHAILELGRLIWYSEERNILYALVEETLYEIDVEKETEKELLTDLQEGRYVVSEDGKLLAYQKEEDEETGRTLIEVMNLNSGSTRTVESESGETITPLGFMNHDLVYGVSREEDSGETVSGETIVPMYKIEIQNSKGKTVKTYQEENVFITDTEFEDNMITLERVTKNGKVYNSIIEDHITNNEEREENNIIAETYTTSLKQRQVRIAYKDGIENKDPQVLKPKQILFEKPTVFSFDDNEEKPYFYVYGHGELQGIFGNAGKAVRQADQYGGVVVSGDQNYVWERGNRDLQYQIASGTEILSQMRSQLESGAAPVEVVKNLYGGEYLDLTGCTPEELMYIINQNRPVIAMKNAKEAVILVGYTETTVTYIGTDDGESHNISLEDLEDMTKKSGHTYIA